MLHLTQQLAIKQSLTIKKQVMKTFKTITAAAILLFFSASSFASDDVKSAKLLIDYTVNTYIDAVAHGKIKPLTEVLDNDVKLSLTIRDNIFNYNKSQIMEALKINTGVEQNCKTFYTILEENNTMAVGKIVLQYPGFSKISFLTMARTKNGWRILNVSDSYK